MTELKRGRRPPLLALALLSVACGCPHAAAQERLPLETIKLPPGFTISLYAAGVEDARSMAVGERGTLFVGSREAGKVYALPDRDGDGRPEEVITIAEGLEMPNGVAVRGGALYVAEVSRVLRYDDIEARLKSPPRPVVVNDGFPKARMHGWKFIAFGPDGLLYVPVGAPCNICELHGLFGTITRMRPNGSGLEIFARGVRNSVGFDWNPATGVLWFTDNGRDWLGENLPPDELDRAPRAGLDFGFPCCYGNNIPDPAMRCSCRGDAAPAMELPAHVAPLGMRFYMGTMFPAPYRGQIFIAEHGSWNRTVPIGYRVTLVRLEGGRAVSREVFAEGWLRPDGQAWGRPVDVQIMADGALLVSDDKAGAIYRISYAR